MSSHTSVYVLLPVLVILTVCDDILVLFCYITVSVDDQQE